MHRSRTGRRVICISIHYYSHYSSTVTNNIGKLITQDNITILVFIAYYMYTYTCYAISSYMSVAEVFPVAITVHNYAHYISLSSHSSPPQATVAWYTAWRIDTVTISTCYVVVAG